MQASVVTAVYSITDDLARRGRRLSERSVVGLFWAASSGLLGGFDEWERAASSGNGPLLRESLAVARTFATSGARPEDVSDLLEELEARTPHGEAVGDVPADVAQACWICADVSIRALAQPSYDAGQALWYAIEPRLNRAEEELSGPAVILDENALAEQVVEHPAFGAAVSSCRWATDFLAERPSPSAET